MQVSVLTPVYNAEPYLREAVESAVAQEETAEVIVVEDGSTDGSRALCEQLEREYSKVKLLGFTDGRAHWIGDKYNLALQYASSDYIAFLEADDYYLPGRFEKAREVFEADAEADGVYEAVEFLFETPLARRLFEQSTIRNWRLRSMKRRVEPENLFEEQVPIGWAGWCHINGWTVRRRVLDRIGPIDNVRGWDMLIFMKFAASGKMVPGRLNEPVAVWRLHDTNDSFPEPPPEVMHAYERRMFETMYRWGQVRLNEQRRQTVLMRLLGYTTKVVRPGVSPRRAHILSLIQLIGLALRVRFVGLQKRYWSRVLSTFAPVVYSVMPSRLGSLYLAVVATVLARIGAAKSPEEVLGS